MLSIVLAFLAWGQGLNWNFSKFSSYKLFPLFGLLASSLLWTQYIVTATNTLQKDPISPARFYRYSSALVLVAILLHPGLLVVQLWRDGFGLPPQSYLEKYVAISARWAAILGTISWLILIAFEFHRKFGKRKWWKYIAYASDFALLAIFIHALKLGSHTGQGWYRYVWLFYGLTYMAALVIIYTNKLNKEKR